MKELKSEVKKDLIRLFFIFQVASVYPSFDLKISLGILIGMLLSWVNFLRLCDSTAKMLELSDEGLIKKASFKGTFARMLIMGLAAGLAIWLKVVNPYALLLSLFSVQVALGVGVIRNKLFANKGANASI